MIETETPAERRGKRADFLVGVIVTALGLLAFLSIFSFPLVQP